VDQEKFERRVKIWFQHAKARYDVERKKLENNAAYNEENARNNNDEQAGDNNEESEDNIM
jgi:hypothetical protein